MDKCKKYYNSLKGKGAWWDENDKTVFLRMLLDLKYLVLELWPTEFFKNL